MPVPPTIWMRQILSPVLRPATRLLVGLIAIPLWRFCRKRFMRWEEWDEELERDVEQWFRASLLLLFATKNVELAIGSWLALEFNLDIDRWYIAAGRILLAIGVVESMPDQYLFPLIHPGPPRLKWERKLGVWQNVRPQLGPVCKGLICQHLNRSSPVFAIMAAIFSDMEGWIFYFLAIGQYLIIGLVTSRDKAVDVLTQFDQQMALRRQELIDEMEMDPRRHGRHRPTATPPAPAGTPTADADGQLIDDSPLPSSPS